MPVYLDVVMLLNFLVDFLLLLGTNRLCGFPERPGRCALGGLLGAVYGGTCLLPGLHFLGNTFWRAVSLVLMAVISFGAHKNALRRAAVFVLLSMALGGVAMGLGDGSFWSIAGAAAGIFALCVLGFRGQLGARSYVPVELYYGGRHVSLTALQDTGNTLRDPVSGRPVLVIAPEAARALTGLSQQQLREPVEAMGALPGLRLIPYKAVGCDSGLMLGIKLSQVKIGSWTGSSLVAFAPEGLSTEGAYEALTGGTV